MIYQAFVSAENYIRGWYQIYPEREQRAGEANTICDIDIAHLHICDNTHFGRQSHDVANLRIW